MAVDDGSFSRRQRWAPLALVSVSSPAYVEAVAVGRVRVDGTDATEAIVDLVTGSPLRDSARVLLVDGIAVGGFNILDLDRLVRETNLAVVSVTRRPPDFVAIRGALRKYFPADFTRRWRLVRAHRLFAVPTEGRPIHAAAVGCSRAQALAVLHRTTVRGYWPEPLRLSRLLARAAGDSSSRRPQRSRSGAAGRTP